MSQEKKKKPLLMINDSKKRIGGNNPMDRTNEFQTSDTEKLCREVMYELGCLSGGQIVRIFAAHNRSEQVDVALNHMLRKGFIFEKGGFYTASPLMGVDDGMIDCAEVFLNIVGNSLDNIVEPTIYTRTMPPAKISYSLDNKMFIFVPLQGNNVNTLPITLKNQHYNSFRDEEKYYDMYRYIYCIPYDYTESQFLDFVEILDSIKDYKLNTFFAKIIRDKGYDYPA